MVGYVLTYPLGQRTPEACRAIEKAISTFDILSGSLAMATSSVKIARDLVERVDLVADRLCTGPMVFNTSMSPVGLLSVNGHWQDDVALMDSVGHGQLDQLTNDAVQIV